jgi:hypothetical protein
MAKKVAPKWTIEETIQIGKEAQILSQSKLQELEPRLSAGLLSGLPADITRLESLFTGRPAKTQEVKGLTGTEADIAKKGARWVSAVREMVKRRATGTGLPKAVGVGMQVYQANSKSTATALEAVLTAARENPEAIRACGILETDLQKGQAMLEAISGARHTQDIGMKDKKDLTTQKDTLQMRIEKAIEEISTSGYIQFMETDPVLAQRFKDLIPHKSRDTEEPPEEPPTTEEKK